MKLTRWICPIASVALAAYCAAWCCEVVHAHAWPQSCLNRVLTLVQPLYYHTCDTTVYSTNGCTALPNTKGTNWRYDYNLCPGTGCQGCEPDKMNMGDFYYTDYQDRPC